MARNFTNVPSSKDYFLSAIALTLYTYSALFLIRYWILPIYFSHLIDSNGNLPWDPQYYWAVAKELAQKMRTEGPYHWHLYADGQGPAGVLALIFWVGWGSSGILILNGLLHIISTIFLCKICLMLTRSKLVILSVLPFAISFYQMHWFSQINKDSFVALGFFALLYGGACLAQSITLSLQAPGLLYSKNLIAFFYIYIGYASVSIGRPYLNQVLTLSTIIALMTAIVISRLPGKQKIYRCIYAATIASGGLFLSSGARSGDIIEKTSTALLAGQSMGSQYPAMDLCLKKATTDWRHSSMLPRSIENKLQTLASIRCNYLQSIYDPHPITRISHIDSNISFSKVGDMIGYLPRALQIGLFAPFPSLWFIKNNGKLSVFYAIVPVEVLFVILATLILTCHLLSTPPVPKQLTQKRLVLTLTIMILIPTMVYGLVAPFVGGLYRLVYPFRMAYIAIGLTVGIHFYSWMLTKIRAFRSPRTFERLRQPQVGTWRQRK